MNEFRFILGAPPGVCAARTLARFHIDELCENCEMPITELDDEVWFCSSRLLGKKPMGGLTVWHEKCLAAAPPSVARYIEVQ